MPSFMPAFNRVFLVGNLTREPEGLRRTPTGIAVTRLRLALNTRVRTLDGRVQEERCFVDVLARGGQAEWAVENLGKGFQVLVDGRLWSEELNKGGRKQTRLSVVAQRLVPMGAPKPRAHSGDTPGRQKDQPAVGGEGAERTAEGDSEDLRF